MTASRPRWAFALFSAAVLALAITIAYGITAGRKPPIHFSTENFAVVRATYQPKRPPPTPAAEIVIPTELMPALRKTLAEATAVRGEKWQILGTLRCEMDDPTHVWWARFGVNSE